MSSIKNNLGLNQHPERVKDKNAEGISELMIDVRNTWKEKLTKEKLFSWHAMVLKDNTKINTGVWRKHKEPMQAICKASCMTQVSPFSLNFDPF